MRPLKFKCYNKKTKDYLFITLEKVDNPHLSRLHVALLSDCIHDDNYVVLQHIGLQDKNQKDIYEGDIIHSPHHIPDKMAVQFLEGGYCCIWPGMLFPLDISHFYSSGGPYIEVVGNINEEEGGYFMPKYYGILKPATEYNKEYISWLGHDSHESWRLFFRDKTHSFPIAEAIEAYKAIGYKCVELEIRVIKEI